MKIEDNKAHPSHSFFSSDKPKPLLNIFLIHIPLGQECYIYTFQHEKELIFNLEHEGHGNKF